MSEFVDYLNEVFAAFGPIRARRMFGGYGIYHQDLMFGLVADDVLYLKADTESRSYFDEQGLPPFEYVKNGKAMAMSYFLAPEEIYDEPDQAKTWAIRAFDAALRSRKPKKPSKNQRNKKA